MIIELDNIEMQLISATDKDIFEMIKTKEVKDYGKISDGYHTFNELYEHRHMLYIALTNILIESAWKSKLHNDGTSYDGWFVLGCTINSKPISYHLPLRLWSLSSARELDVGLVWDGHTSENVLERLLKFNKLTKDENDLKIKK